METPPLHTRLASSDEVSLLDCWRVLRRYKKLIAYIVCFCTVSALIYALVATKIYRAEARIIPVGGQAGVNLAAIMGNSPMAALLGGGANTGASSQLQVILESRSLREKLINRLGLIQIYFGDELGTENSTSKVSGPPYMDKSLMKLEAFLTVTSDASTSELQIEGLAKTPERAAELVNTAVVELGNFLAVNALTSAKRFRIFLENQLETNKVQLLETGKEISKFYSANKISNRDPRIDVDVSISNDDMPALQERMDKQQEQLMESRTSIEQELKRIRLVKDVPQQVYFEYLNRYYLVLSEMTALLTQQYEMAKMSEAKEDISFQIIDWARPPELRYKPKRTLIVVIGFFLSLVIAITTAFVLDFIRRNTTELVENGNGTSSSG